MDNKIIDLSVIIPVYKSENILWKLSSELTKTISNMTINYEVIFVSDASPDNSFKVIKLICENNSNFKGIQLRNNIGQHRSVIVGMGFASGKYVITMDDDLQHSPIYIPELLDKIKLGYDVVYCSFNSKSHSLWKIMGSRVVDYIMVKALNKPKELYLSPYRVLTIEVCKEIIKSQNKNSYIDVLILKITDNISSISGIHFKRNYGKSNYNLRKSILLFLKMITGFTVYPLKLVTSLGLIIFFVSFLLILLLIVNRLLNNNTPIEWSSLIVTIIFLSGAQLVGIRLLGEYLGRIFSSTDSKPIFSIKEKVGL